jgi:hypothetical protein
MIHLFFLFTLNCTTLSIHVISLPPNTLLLFSQRMQITKLVLFVVQQIPFLEARYGPRLCRILVDMKKHTVSTALHCTQPLAFSHYSHSLTVSLTLSLSLSQVVFFAKTSELHILNKAIIYARDNELCDRIIICHVHLPQKIPAPDFGTDLIPLKYALALPGTTTTESHGSAQVPVVEEEEGLVQEEEEEETQAQTEAQVEIEIDLRPLDRVKGKATVKEKEKGTRKSAFKKGVSYSSASYDDSFVEENPADWDRDRDTDIDRDRIGYSGSSTDRDRAVSVSVSVAHHPPDYHQSFVVSVLLLLLLLLLPFFLRAETITCIAVHCILNYALLPFYSISPFLLSLSSPPLLPIHRVSPFTSSPPPRILPVFSSLPCPTDTLNPPYPTLSPSTSHRTYHPTLHPTLHPSHTQHTRNVTWPLLGPNDPEPHTPAQIPLRLQENLQLLDHMYPKTKVTRRITE